MSPEQPIVIHAPVHGAPELLDLPATPERPAAPMLTVHEDVAPAPAPSAAAEPAPRRAFSVDALRGLFLLSMTFGFSIAFTGFPTWMYHRQMPPPSYEVVPIPGISWRDLAYGAFLFTMAAALPLTTGRRIAKGETEIGIVLAALRRFGMLVFFGILVAHSNTYFIGYTQVGRSIAIAGFVAMALVFTRRRQNWDEARFRAINRLGWVLAILFLVATPLLYGQRFTPTRHDDIITGLAFASLVGTIVWYFTREHLRVRLGVLAAVIGLYALAKSPGWVQSWWYDTPAPWAFSPNMLSLLTIVIPGTIAGDVVLRWMRSTEVTGLAGWTRGRVAALALLSAVFTPLVVFGLYNRIVVVTALAVIALGVGIIALSARPVTATERMLSSLSRWTMAWLVLGLLLEPVEGGIRKVPETLSYFFVVAGLTTSLLVSFTGAIDGLKKTRWFAPLIEVGHNPLLAYVLFTILLNSLLELIPPTRGLLSRSAGEAVLFSVLATAAVALIVGAVSRRRIYWRT